MGDDQVKRYQLDYHHTQTYAEMVEDCDGDWVKYNDYKAASDRIEELELAVRYEADLAQQALDARKELAAKLAKAAAEIEEAWKVPKSDASWGILQVMIKYALSELKGPDDAE